MREPVHLICVFAGAALFGIAGSSRAADVPDAGGQDTHDISGTYEVVKRVMPDGKEILPPAIGGLYSMKNGRGNLNLFWKEKDGKLVSESTIMRYTLSAREYCEWIVFTSRNNVDKPGVSNEAPAVTNHCSPVTMRDGRTVFEPAGEGVVLSFDENGFTATGTTEPFVDHWRRMRWTNESARFAKVDDVFADYALDSHIPGVVYGIVADGRLVYVRGLGVQDLESNRPVTPDTSFRIASMTKAFTALTVLKLRDDGKLHLDAPVETYVPELRAWKYPTQDSPRIRVRDLLNHTAGFVTDDPWGDRQTPLPESEFSLLLREGVPFARPPATAMEYSNLGFALLGRVITNVSGHPYAETIAHSLLQPLGMGSSGFFVDAARRERRALGYRWEDDAWSPEPTMAHGAFGAMGGVQTSAIDYAKWVAYLLSAWPPRDEADRGPVKRATVRELAQGSNFPLLRQRPGHTGADACRQAATYGMGMWVAVDCDLGLTLSHGGGYPGYGSHVLLLPDHGVGIFAFANRTYAGPSAAVWDAAVALRKAGFLEDRSAPVGVELASAYRTVAAIYQQGDVAAGGDRLAMNFLLDRDASGWSRDLADLKKKVGTCDTTAPVKPTGALAGEFTWRCTHGRVTGSVLLAPTRPPRIQSIKLEQKTP